jgi:dihydrodipicolinate synthase/N-acetylneuraminate lyase
MIAGLFLLTALGSGCSKSPSESASSPTAVMQAVGDNFAQQVGQGANTMQSAQAAAKLADKVNQKQEQQFEALNNQ